MSSNIAIIIPAYKSKYLASTMDSLVNQTDQRFSVYIGDDCSPSGISEIVDRYTDRLRISYTRFPYNLGQTDLVGHWTRCLNLMSGNEEWFMMFSDDDVMEPHCMEKLHQVVDHGVDHDVLHFNLKLINFQGEVDAIPPHFPQVLSSLDFCRSIQYRILDARMPEFVFRTRHFLKQGGFIPFDMAMRTDNATVIRAAFLKGIFTIPGCYVQWRGSEDNLCNIRSRKMKLATFRATVDYFNWMEAFCCQKGVNEPVEKIQKMCFLFKLGIRALKYIGLRETYSLLNSSNDITNNKQLLPLMVMKYLVSR